MPAKISQSQTQLSYAVVIAVLLTTAAILFDNPKLDNVEIWVGIGAFGLSVCFGSFMVLRGYAIVRHHGHEGWRRLLIVAGVVGAVVGLSVVAVINPYSFRRVDGETILLAAMGLLLGFGGTITVSTEAVRLVKWVVDGFRTGT